MFLFMQSLFPTCHERERERESRDWGFFFFFFYLKKKREERDEIENDFLRSKPVEKYYVENFQIFI
jgi:hypothetical protein